MVRHFVLAALLTLTSSPSYDQKIRVVDEDGAPVQQFEAKWHTAQRGHGHWERGGDGTWHLAPQYLRNTEIVDVEITSASSASILKNWANCQIASFAKMEAEVRQR